MENKRKSNRKNDNWVSSLRVTTSPLNRYSKIMSAMILVALQILLLLLKAHFTKDDDVDKAMEAIKQAQGKLAEIAEQLESKVRYSTPPQAQIDHIQDKLDQERNTHDKH